VTMSASHPHTLCLLALAALGATACTRPPLQTPPRFLELQESAASSYVYRASTADGVVLAVRALDLDPERGGDLPFWIEAVTRQLRARGGYALLEQSETKTRAGLRGHQLRFGRDDKNKTYRYWLSLFLTRDRLYVVEAGGLAEAFDAHREQIEGAIASLEP
jgi:hypothetical protein